MLKKLLIVLVSSFISISFFTSLINAHEIHLKDGRIFKTESCWEEDGIVYYLKYGATIGINKDFVKEIKKDNIINKRVENSIGMVFSYIPPGSFRLGYFQYETGQKEGHEVTLTKGFYMQTTEVTIGQWNAVMKNVPVGRASSEKDNFPKSKVSFHQIKEFINKLNSLEKTTRYRMPTEAEWEYACRAGTTTAYFWGDSIDCSKANYGGFQRAPYANTYEWPCAGLKNRGRPMKVRSFPPNKWGIYDMHGNVEEICLGEYAPPPSSPVISPKIIRKGGEFTTSVVLRLSCAARSYGLMSVGERRVGFRLVLEE